MMFENRKYRTKSIREGLVSFTVTAKETDLHIQAKSDLSQTALKKMLELRGFVEAYIKIHPEFKTSFVPVKPAVTVMPEIIMDMIDASKKAGVGPMAAIAGAIAEHTGKELLKYSPEVIVENGGDIFFKTNSDIIFSIFAGKSPLSMKVGARITRHNSGSGMALCTSSGTVGHSVSFGKADAATVIARSCAVADAAATAIGNIVNDSSDIENAIEMGKRIKGVMGIVIIKGKRLGAWGELELVKL